MARSGRSRARSPGLTARSPLRAATGIREWLGQLTPASRRIGVAAFDTKIRKPALPGSAARAAQRRLRCRGFAVLEPTETFWVRGTQGPLCDGEEERARQWGARMASELTARQPAR